MNEPTLNKIDLAHMGPTGHKTPYDDIVALDAAGIPWGYKITDTDIDERILILARNTSTPNYVVFRRSVGIQGTHVYDVPLYGLTPEDASSHHFELHFNELPPLVKQYNDVVIIETINEPNKDDGAIVEWLAEFSLYQWQSWNAEGFKYACFGWAGGTPEPRHWEGDKMLSLLRTAAANRGRLFIAVHEYSLDSNIWRGAFPNDDQYWYIGRFTWIHKACDIHGIAYPDILITEWGYGKDKFLLPDIAQRMADYDSVGRFYAKYPNVKQANVWAYNGAGEWGDLGDELYHNDRPQLLNLRLVAEYPPVEGVPPVTKPKIVIVKKPQITMMTNAENTEVGNWAFANYGRTATHSHDDMMRMLSGGNDQSYAVVWWADRQPDVIQILEDAGYAYELMPEGEPPPTTGFSFTHWPTQYKHVTQLFGVNPSNYEPFGLPGHGGVDIRAYTGSNLFAVADGVVSRVENTDNSNLGIQVRIDHIDNYQTTYAHMQDTAVSVGQVVSGGDIIGRADNTGNSFGSHLHNMLKRIGHTYVDGNGQSWPYNIFDPTPYLKAFHGVTWPGETVPPPIGRRVAIRKYFEPANEYGRKIVFRFDNGVTQPQQLKRQPDGTITLLKGDGQTIDGKLVYDYERFFFDGVGNLRRKEDTSVGGRNAYDQNDAMWLPSVITEGQTYVNPPTITTYDRVSCQQLSESTTTDYLTFKKFHESWTSPQNANITIPNVIELEWRKSQNGNVEERYFLAEGILYAAWNNGAIHEFADGQQPISGELTDC